jgi:lipopolysaccharide transport system permease protein
MSTEKWTTIINPRRSLLHIDLRAILRGKYLLFLFVRRDFVSIYKQTLLGSLWFFIQPILTTAMFVLVFSGIAGIQTDGIPPILFYLAGLTCWNYFAECLNKTSNTFIENQHIFGKVYFPRILTPLSVVLTSLLKFGIQFLLFAGVYIYYLIQGEAGIEIQWPYLLFFPVLVGIMGLLGLAIGMIVSSLTTKYRDLRFLIQFGVQLWMYATPIIYPMSLLHGKMHTIVSLNPMTSIVETFKFTFLGKGAFDIASLGYTVAVTLVLLIVGIIIFNRTEQNFMDTV